MDARQWRTRKHELILKNEETIRQKLFCLQREEIEYFLSTDQKEFKPTVFAKLPEEILQELAIRGFVVTGHEYNPGTIMRFWMYKFE